MKETDLIHEKARKMTVDQLRAELVRIDCGVSKAERPREINRYLKRKTILVNELASRSEPDCEGMAGLADPDYPLLP